MTPATSLQDLSENYSSPKPLKRPLNHPTYEPPETKRQKEPNTDETEELIHKPKEPCNIETIITSSQKPIQNNPNTNNYNRDRDKISSHRSSSSSRKNDKNKHKP